MLKSNDVILVLGGALFGALYAAMVYFSLQGFNMVQVFYAFMPLDYDRPGGVWWYRVMTSREVNEFIESIRSCATAIRVSTRCVVQDPDNIKPPEDATVIK